MARERHRFKVRLYHFLDACDLGEVNTFSNFLPYKMRRIIRAFLIECRGSQRSGDTMHTFRATPVPVTCTARNQATGCQVISCPSA